MAKFDTIKKCNNNFSGTFNNIYGKEVLLSIKKQNNVLGVTVKEKSNIYFHFILYIIIFLLNIASLIYSVINITIFSIIFVILILFTYIKSGSIIEETFISIEPLGYQLITKYFIGQKSKFIPYEKVQQIFINEVICKQKVICLLTILTKESNRDTLIPLFAGSKPRLNCLELIYNTIFENKG